MSSRRSLGLIGALCAVAAALTLSQAALPQRAEAKPYLPDPHKIIHGLNNSGQYSEIKKFTRQTGAHPAVLNHYLTWGRHLGEGRYFWEKGKMRGMITLGTSAGHGKSGVITPAEIARGAGDRWLMQLNRVLARWGDPVYMNLFAEMNGYWNDYSGFERGGGPRSERSPKSSKRAWKRITLLLRGGEIKKINRELRKQKMHKIRGLRGHRPRSGRLPRAKIAMIWTPMWKGSPNIPANSPSSYWPGSRWVDWVGTDTFSEWANLGGLNVIYNQFARRYHKPMCIPEYAPWSGGLRPADDAWFVEDLHRWAERKSLVRMLIYYQGFGAGDWNPFKLEALPHTRKTLRSLLNKKRYQPYLPGQHSGRQSDRHSAHGGTHK